MKIWFHRIFALALISLGISMIFLPFNNTRSGSTEIETVSIEQLKFSNLDEIKVQYPNVDIIDITGSKLNQDDYPNLWDKLIQIAHYDIKNEHGDLNEWNNFQINYFGELSTLRLIVFREGLIECAVTEIEGSGDKVVLFRYLGKYNPYIKELTALDLEDYPMILKIVKNLEVGNELNYESNTLPKKKWDQMVGRYLDPINDLQIFNFNGNFYAPQFSWEVSYMSGEIVVLRTILKIVGLSLFVIGFLLIKKLYYWKKER
ncbi:MAG: hypothetical protein QM495_09610 [Lutibacter sp.]|uniref:hypothetical protein n=1 Tax=Lutibacter sp. TaxID=1925666 RepID=UPI00385EA911